MSLVWVAVEPGLVPPSVRRWYREGSGDRSHHSSIESTIQPWRVQPASTLLRSVATSIPIVRADPSPSLHPGAKTLQLLAKPNPPAAAAAGAADGGDGGEPLLQHSHQLYKWHSDLQAAMSSETEHQYSAYAAALQGHLTTADDILAKVNKSLLKFEDARVLCPGAEGVLRRGGLGSRWSAERRAHASSGTRPHWRGYG